MVDLHVTASSTCANEALAFGTPTVLLGVLARQLFGEPIERGLMFYASDPTQFYILAQQAMELPRETLKEAGDSFFVSNPEERQRAVDRVVEIVCDAQDKRTERTAT